MIPLAERCSKCRMFRFRRTGGAAGWGTSLGDWGVPSSNLGAPTNIIKDLEGRTLPKYQPWEASGKQASFFDLEYGNRQLGLRPSQLATETAKTTARIELAALPAKPDPVVMYEGKGGSIPEHDFEFSRLAETGASVEMRGGCYSACTLLTSYFPKERLCFGEGAPWRSMRRGMI